MKKTLLSALVAVLGFATQATAQSSITATLIHDNDIKTFYGASALREAHAAATHGDVITLSSGRFTSTNIYKAITLRGAGMEYDSVSVTEPTIISGSFNISVASDSTTSNHSFRMEAIYHKNIITVYGELTNPQFVKCRLSTIKNIDSNAIGLVNAQFIHCAIVSYLYIHNGSAALYNCFVEDPRYHTSGNTSVTQSTGTYEFQNCVIKTSQANYIERSILRNSIIHGTATTQGSSCNELPSSAYAYNCVGTAYNTFANQITKTNRIASITNLFKTWTGNQLNGTITGALELTEEAKTKYLGSDGTEVGIYGGSLPFEARTSNPQITKLNVASKSTADGKLSVDIEVKAAE